jgi:biopolymer transport protein ExbB
MNIKTHLILLPVLAAISIASAQELPKPQPSFGDASSSIKQQLEEALSELAKLREGMAAEKIPLDARLRELEAELTRVRLEYQQTVRQLDSRTLDLGNLNNEIKGRKEEISYLTNLFNEYIRNFESRLHIAELQLFRKPLEVARLAVDKRDLPGQEDFAKQIDVLLASVERLHNLAGGILFEGSAVDTGGIVKQGKFVVVGPAAIFVDNEAKTVGTADQRLGSLEASITPFTTPEDIKAAVDLTASGTGVVPFDPTLGNAHKVEAIEETFVEHLQKGGPVVWPIGAVALVSVLVTLFKWLGLSSTPKPGLPRLRPLLEAIKSKDKGLALQRAKALKGPTGKMLVAGVEHMDEPRELMEEVMYETVLAARLKLQRLLPLLAVCASAAPLLGLLGTVTGIMNTFSLITIFGSGDIKTLSSGISEALITTELGLYVAIPSLLAHALLSRKARAITDSMDQAAVAFINQVTKSAETQPVTEKAA